MKRWKLIILTIILIIHAFLMACTNNRQKLAPSEALIGHWKTEMEKTEYYFSDNQMIMVEKGKKSEPIQYRIVYKRYPHGIIIELGEEYDDRKNKIFIGHRKILVFMENNHTLVEDAQFGRVVDGEIRWTSWGTELWRFIDQKQNP